MIGVLYIGKASDHCVPFILGSFLREVFWAVRLQYNYLLAAFIGKRYVDTLIIASINRRRLKCIVLFDVKKVYCKPSSKGPIAADLSVASSSIESNISLSSLSIKLQLTYLEEVADSTHREYNDLSFARYQKMAAWMPKLDGQTLVS
jgi:hypothetical protein